MRRLLFLTALVTTLASSSSAWALEELIHNYRGIRQLGMGGVATTTGMYDEALFNNPAMQAEDPEWKVTILGITAETDTHFLSDYSKLSSAKSAGGTGTLSSIANSGMVGNVEHARLTLLTPAYYSPRFLSDNFSFAVGLLINNQSTLVLHQDSIIEAQQFDDIGPAFGFGYRLLDGNLDVGLNLRVLYRLAGDPSIKPTQFLTGQKLTLSTVGGQGVGIDGDIGAYYKLPFEVPFFKKLSVGGSFNNFLQSTYRTFGTKLVKTINTFAPGNDRTGALGVRGDLPDFSITSNSLFAIEFQDIGTTRRLATFWKKFHFGGETHFLGKLLAVRAGFNQGYVTGGVGVDLPIVKIDLATYGEEMGSNTGMVEDRRIALRLSFDI